MANSRLPLVIPIFLSVLAALLLRQSPYVTMANVPAPSGAKPWADTPMGLVDTPAYTTKESDLFTTGATHMALLHNAIIRGYNSIWHQATRVPDGDKADFMGYCLCWYKFVKSHHDHEEGNLFTKVKEILGGDDKIWEATHVEHESFLEGLASFEEYLVSLPNATAFSGTKLRTIMSSFETPFEEHFHNEIETIASLALHPACPKPGTEEETQAAMVFKAWGKATVSKAGMVDVLPFFLMNLDETFEEGMWMGWPPMPGPIRWVFVNLVGGWHGGWWRFASCGGDGLPRELYGMGFPEVGEEETPKEGGKAGEEAQKPLAK